MGVKATDMEAVKAWALTDTISVVLPLAMETLVALPPDMVVSNMEHLPVMAILVAQDMAVILEELDMVMKISQAMNLSDTEKLVMEEPQEVMEISEAHLLDTALEVMKNSDRTLEPASEVMTSEVVTSQLEDMETSEALQPDMEASEATNRSQITDMVDKIRMEAMILAALQLAALTAMLVMAMLDSFPRK